MAFRVLDQNPVYLDNSGAPLSGGFLAFYDTGTTNPRNTWSDKALTSLNANPVPLDSAGRANTEIWGSGSYRVRLYDSGMNQVYQRDNVDELVTGSGLPTQTGNSGKFLTTNGSAASWATIIQLPSPTGSAGKYAYTADGVNISWKDRLNDIKTQTVASSATITPTASEDVLAVTALATNVTIANPTGTWVNGQGYVVRLKDNGTARTINFDTKFRAVGVTLPTTTIANKLMYIGFIYHSTDDKFDVVSLAKEA